MAELGFRAGVPQTITWPRDLCPNQAPLPPSLCWVGVIPSRVLLPPTLQGSPPHKDVERSVAMGMTVPTPPQIWGFQGFYHGPPFHRLQARLLRPSLSSGCLESLGALGALAGLSKSLIPTHPAHHLLRVPIHDPRGRASPRRGL